VVGVNGYLQKRLRINSSDELLRLGDCSPD
jgi:hypothetical protein